MLENIVMIGYKAGARSPYIDKPTILLGDYTEFDDEYNEDNIIIENKVYKLVIGPRILGKENTLYTFIKGSF